MSLPAVPLERRLAAALASPQAALDQLDKADCEASLPFFIRRFWHVLEPARPVVWSWHLDVICEHLCAISRGEMIRLLINLPPGMMKSLVMVFWTAWEWGPSNQAHIRVVNFSYSSSLTLRDNRRLRRLIGDPTYQKWWGDRVQVNPNLDSQVLFELRRTGFSLATSVGGVGTGERGDRIKVDDPHNVKTGESEAVRSTTVEWFSETLTTRMIDPSNSTIMVIMQRVHEKDVSGYILASDLGYEHLMLPMEFEPERRCYTSLKRGNAEPIYARYLGGRQMWLPEGWRPERASDLPLLDDYRKAETREVYPQDIRTEEGELLAPGRFPPEVVERDKKALREYAVAGQFQQRPAPRGGLLFNRSAFRYTKVVPAGTIFVRHWDLAATEEKVMGRGARTAGVLLGYTPSKDYIIVDCDTVMERDPRPHVRRVAEADKQRWGKVHISIPQDPGQGGKVTASDYVKMLNGYNVSAQPERGGDKLDRAEPLAAQVEAGNVYILEGGSWIPGFLDEVSRFPTGSRKDIVDSMSGGYAWLLGRPPGGSFTVGVRGHG